MPKELAPLVVERAATRFADETRSLANRLEVWTIVFWLIALTLLVADRGRNGLAPIVVPAGLGGVTLLASRRRRALANHAETVAQLAQKYPDIGWTEHAYYITGRTPDGLKQTIVLNTTPRSDEQLSLPAARVMKRDD